MWTKLTASGNLTFFIFLAFDLVDLAETEVTDVAEEETGAAFRDGAATFLTGAGG